MALYQNVAVILLYKNRLSDKTIALQIQKLLFDSQKIKTKIDGCIIYVYNICTVHNTVCNCKFWYCSSHFMFLIVIGLGYAN